MYTMPRFSMKMDPPYGLNATFCTWWLTNFSHLSIFTLFLERNFKKCLVTKIDTTNDG